MVVVFIFTVPEIDTAFSKHKIDAKVKKFVTLLHVRINYGINKKSIALGKIETAHFMERT